MVRQKEIGFTLKKLDKYLLKEYKNKYSFKRKNSLNYEIDFHKRIKFAVKNLSKLIKQACLEIKIIKNTGRPPKLTLEQKLRIILIKHLIDKSNRFTSDLLSLFTLMFNIEASYKTIERLYSDTDVKLGLHNLFMLIIKEKGINEIDSCGDATGYSLTITKHYCNYATQLKEKSKVANCRRQFAYNFTLMDLETKMYICYGSSLKSEKDAYNKAVIMFKETKVKIKSLRLDRYYSGKKTVKEWENTILYLIPKKNTKLKNSGYAFKEMLNRFVKNTLGYLKEYYKRNNSESGFSSDKKLLGWKINQKREDRIDTAIFCKVIWRNLFQLGL